MKVLVTGGGGFLGLRIVKFLLKENFEVISTSRSRYVELENLNVKQIQKNLNDLESSDLEGVEAIIHTAALAGVWGRKEDFYKTNLDGTRHLVDLAKKCKIKYFIYTSSPSVVFGEDDIEGLDEKVPYPSRFYTFYQETKKLAEEYVLLNTDSEFLAVSIRPHLIWGPNDPHLFPRIIERARLGKLKRVGNGENLVDIIYVDNAASAHVKALKALIVNPELSKRSYFIGQERPVNLWDFISEILNRSGIEQIESSVSFKAAFNIGFILEKCFKLLGIYRPEPPMTRFLALQLAKSHYFSHKNAVNDFGYVPEVTIEEGLSLYFKERNENKKIIDKITLANE